MFGKDINLDLLKGMVIKSAIAREDGSIEIEGENGEYARFHVLSNNHTDIAWSIRGARRNQDG
jgi:hypothetical protein